MDQFGIDGHKLHYHVRRVSDWLAGEAIYPIYMEISPSGACNHRCTFCAKDFMGYQPTYLDTGVLKELLSEMGAFGVKSTMYAGEGEPLLHRDIAEIIRHTRAAGIDVAVTTNGVPLRETLGEEIIGAVDWIKVSINAGTPETYSRIHRCRPTDFEQVIRNMETAARLRSQGKHRCALGMQMLLLPENWDEAVTLAGIARDIGMDYVVVKPYSHHPASKTKKYSRISYRGHAELVDRLEEHNTETFHVVFRARTMQTWDVARRDYGRCFALPFWAYLDSRGDLWGCSTYLADDRFRYGNVYEDTFEGIWNGEKRSQALTFMENGFDLDGCRLNCRMDKINRYLWNLKHPPNHVNFI
jgi:MoaA/NifB/PqqE/SkfB family radical SAM enzyme